MKTNTSRPQLICDCTTATTRPRSQDSKTKSETVEISESLSRTLGKLPESIRNLKGITLLAELGRLRLVLIDAEYVVTGKVHHATPNDVRWTFPHFEPAWEQFFVAALDDLQEQFAVIKSGSCFTPDAAVHEFPPYNPSCFAVLTELEGVIERWHNNLTLLDWE